MACLSEFEPRRLFPPEIEPEMVTLTNPDVYLYIFCCIQDKSPSRSSLRDGSPDVNELCRVSCTCKSTCQRRNCPCKKEGLFCRERCKCGTRRNPCKNRVNNIVVDHRQYLKYVLRCRHQLKIIL